MRQNRITPILLLAAAIIITGLAVSKKQHSAEFIDGRYFNLGASMFIERKSPYALDGFRKELAETAEKHSPTNNPELALPIDSYAYPPASLIFYAPLGLFEYPIAKRLLNIVNVLLMPLAAWVAVVFFGGYRWSTSGGPMPMVETPAHGGSSGPHASILGIGIPLSPGAMLLLLFVLTLGVGMMHFSFPITITLGQTAIIVLFALMVAIFAIETRNTALAAACAALAAIKPQVMLLPIAAVLIRERAWREGIAVVICVAVSNLAAMVFIYHSGLVGEMTDSVTYNRSLDVNQAANTYGGLFLGTRSWVMAAANPLLITSGLVAVVWAACFRDRYPKHTATVAALLLTLYAMPLHHYDFVLILPVLLGLMTISPSLGLFMLVLTAGIDREVISQTLLVKGLGITGITHQTLHAVYILIGFIAIQGYIFLRALGQRASRARV